jgi:hypothetical protein
LTLCVKVSNDSLFYQNILLSMLVSFIPGANGTKKKQIPFPQAAVLC